MPFVATCPAHQVCFDLFNKGVASEEIGNQVDPLAPATAAHLASLGPLVPVDEEDYCPITFNGSCGVPESLGLENQVLEEGGFVFVIGSDGWSPDGSATSCGSYLHYYKFTRPQK